MDLQLAPDMKKYIICSNKAYFYLQGGHNIQKDRVYAMCQPNEVVEQALHDGKALDPIYLIKLSSGVIIWRCLRNFFGQRSLKL